MLENPIAVTSPGARQRPDGSPTGSVKSLTTATATELSFNATSMGYVSLSSLLQYR